MTKINITSLHSGMNLRDPASEVLPGETGVSIGLDWHVPGQVSPMHEDALIQVFANTIVDAHYEYIGGVRYLFTTDSTGLSVSWGYTTALIDAAFTGLFKVLIVNNQYAVFSNSTLVRKWMPSWTATEQWGLNTPPAPTTSLVALTSQVIDDFESLTGWVKAGGGTAGALTLDTVNFVSGAASINMAASAHSSISMTKPVTLDLSKFLVPGDLGLGWIDVWFLTPDLTAVTALHVLFDCSTGANFKTDWYQADITISNVASKNLTYAAGGTVDVPTSGGATIPVTPSGQVATWTYDASQDQIDIVGIPTSKTKKQDIVKYEAFKISDQPLDFKQVVVLTKKKRQTVATSEVWMHFRFQLSEFTRHGGTSNRDWSTVTAIQIKFDCGATAGSVNVDSLNLLGGGFPFGNYWFAQAYENQFGNYGPYSEFTGPIDAEGQQILVSGLTADTDTQTVKRRIAVIGGSMTDPMVFWINDNTTTSYTYNLQDTSLSTIETNFNNDPPPPVTDMILDAGRIFAVTGETLIYSDIDYYEGFPAANVITFASESLMQVASLQNQFIAARGQTEHLVQLLSSDPTTWAITDGAREGAASSRLLIELPGGQHAWASAKYFWQSADSEYLPKIGYAVSDFTQVFGRQAGNLVYLFFTDTSGTARVLRIDYRLGDPIAHYVENITPSCIFDDSTEKQIFYALGNSIYQFDAGAGPLATALTIPEQFDKSARQKSFNCMNYDLQNGPLTFQVVRERATLAGTYNLPNSALDGDAVSLPRGTGISQGLIVTSVPANGPQYVDQNGVLYTDQNGNPFNMQGVGHALTLPVILEYAEV